MNENKAINSRLMEIMRESAGKKNDERYSEDVGPKLCKPVVEEGEYDSVITDVGIEKDVISAYGKGDKLTIEYSTFISTDYGDIEEIALKQNYWVSNSTSSGYYRTLKELLGKNPMEGFKLSDLLGLPCRVTVTHNTTEKGTFSNVASVEKLQVEEDLEAITI